jgi:hypothetical protein
MAGSTDSLLLKFSHIMYLGGGGTDLIWVLVGLGTGLSSERGRNEDCARVHTWDLKVFFSLIQCVAERGWEAEDSKKFMKIFIEIKDEI